MLGKQGWFIGNAEPLIFVDHRDQDAVVAFDNKGLIKLELRVKIKMSAVFLMNYP